MSPPASGTTSLPQATGLAHDFKPLFGPIAQGGELRQQPFRIYQRMWQACVPPGCRDLPSTIQKRMHGEMNRNRRERPADDGVAFFAILIAAPFVTMTATLFFTRSAARAGSRS